MTIEEQEKVCNEKFKAIFKSIKKIESLVDSIHTLTLSVGEIAHTLKFIEVELKQNKIDIADLKNDKLEKYNKISQMVATAIISAIIGYVLKGIGL